MKPVFFAAVILLAAPAGPLNAQASMTADAANLRSGPGTGYQVLASIPPGQPVDVESCSGSWCRVAWQGVAGFLARSLLTRTSGAPGAADAAPPLTVYRAPPPPGPNPYQDVPYWYSDSEIYDGGFYGDGWYGGTWNGYRGPGFWGNGGWAGPVFRGPGFWGRGGVAGGGFHGGGFHGGGHR